MVYYFTSNVVEPSAYIYMGKDKVESQFWKSTEFVWSHESWCWNLADEDLIQYGWDEDVWFHVDNLSSAHVYVRMRDGEKWDAISNDLLIDCAQLTKANSIEGNP
jgi:hypothetical protein